jgi:phosphoglycerate dehydrogenase-like enzyme
MHPGDCQTTRNTSPIRLCARSFRGFTGERLVLQLRGMSEPPLTIWCNFRPPQDVLAILQAGVLPHVLQFPQRVNENNLQPGRADEGCRTADVAFGQPNAQDIIASTTLRWVHLTSAGYARFDRDDVRSALAARDAVLTNSSWVYDNPCAQHVLAMMMCHNRRLDSAAIDQHSHKSWIYKELRPRMRVLDGQSVLIVGMGAIGRRLVELLAPYRVRIESVRRRVRGDEPVPTYASAELDRLLGQFEHVVNLLPSSPGNEKIFNADRFARFREGAAFYNVGRGDTVDQPALIAALESGRVAGAYLDVTTPEPLPPDDPLWRAPHCLITPHVAGGLQDELARLVDHFLENFRRFTSGRELINRIM